MNSRRELFRIGAVLASSAAAPAQAPAAPRFFKKAELDLLAILVEHIIPATETPGAAAANVHFYIDWLAHANKAAGARLRKDLYWIAKRNFSSKDHAGQVALLAEWSNAAGEPRRIFQTIKDLTIDGYYGTREGLQTELGWNGNVFVREFKGCTHPEHA